MKYVDEYRDIALAKRISRRIHDIVKDDRRSYTFMEVCGTHTNTFFKFGLRSLLPPNVRLISGPGCPVCVTDNSYIDNAISLAGLQDVVITTFGDMMKVPGTSSSLDRERARGRDIRMVYSALDALKIAQKNHSKDIVFLAVGFETTAPTIGATVLEAAKRNIKNFFVYCGHKLIPPPMAALLKNRDVRIDGFLLPAHVSAIIGADAYVFLRKYKTPGVISGFEPLDMLQGIAMLLGQLKSGTPKIEIQYDRVVKKSGNRTAQHLLKKVFRVSGATWRGLGAIPLSGYQLRDGFGDFDAYRHFKFKKARPSPADRRNCLCGEVLKGAKMPEDCGLFAKACTPENPKGPCMVSSEGSCAIHYRYSNKRR